jgi:hypothetical protein
MIGRTLIRDSGGSSAAEFALVLPLLLILLFGVIDGGRFIWEYNRAEKATQMGARMAVVTAPVAGGLVTADFTGVGGLTAGGTIPASALPDVTCNDSSCTCSGCPSGVPGAYNSTAFNNIVARMQLYKPDIKAANVEVVYRGSGLGYAGDPTGADVSPLVTVRLKSLQFNPITSLMFATISLGDFSTTLTAEDMAGTQSN